eukprot:1587119-Rhodomonas_salina.1
MAAMAEMRASQRQVITKTVAASTAFPRITSTSTIPSSARLHAATHPHTHTHTHTHPFSPRLPSRASRHPASTDTDRERRTRDGGAEEDEGEGRPH